MRQLYKPAALLPTIGSGIYRGSLAEPYDGIGQYVMVALAGSSLSAAYRARVATGDFGGDRTFPRGTPVTIVSNRGNIEVFLGNLANRCKITFPIDTDPGEGFGPVVGAPANPDFPDWLMENCEPPDDWWRGSLPSVLYVQDGEAIIDLLTNPGFINDDPWIWYRTGDNSDEFTVGDDKIEFLINLTIELPTHVLGDSASPQIDFYWSSDDRIGGVGVVGDAYYLTLDSSEVGSFGLGKPQYPNMRVGFFDNLGMGYPGITDLPSSQYQEYSVPGSDDKWNNELFVRWGLERQDNGYAVLHAKIWLADDVEPDDWQAYWTDLDDTNWRGMHTFIIGPYLGNQVVTGFPYLPSKYRIKSIEDVSRKLCKLEGDRESDPCNG